MVTQSIHPVIAWAHSMLQNPSRIAILDTETTDMHGQIIDLAIINGEGETLFNSLIQPVGGERITDGAQRVHGISDDMLLDAPTLALVWPEIYALLADKERIVCYNVAFDSMRLSHSCKHNGIDGVSSNPGKTTLYLLPPWSCAMKQYALYWNELSTWGESPKWQSLNKACAQQEIAHHNWHRALGDCQATLKLLQCLTAKYPDYSESEETNV